MSSSSSRPRRRTADASPCPCGSSSSYGACCGPLHSGQSAAADAKTLMRSRFSAFAVQDEAYLLRTWHPGTRPARIDFDRGTRWTGLDILDTDAGSPFHPTGTVTFRAHYTHRGRAGTLRERSRFVRYEGAWVYMDGEISAE
ncbi:YchJ family protein [Streptomyces gobiensis]|uniref:YchJ family protein n=1 Tax=Streptomyces gobiensis TaxID=2875706 RepID=UPI001E5667C3|nr:YchJ family metal-binding protein [Streptomyces gobiensis]UGY94107.1 hypothetical protein test1122_21900 [Streptomyces gobiensis]